MARIAGINIPQNKVVSIALTYIHGIGLHSSKKICKKLDIPSSKRVNELSEEQVLKIREFIDANHKVEGDLRREVSVNIKRLVDLACYRGSRHKKKLPVRGQRTQCNARTRKGKAIAIAGKKLTPLITTGIAYRDSTFNNTIMSIVDESGNVVAWSSAGAKGFKGSRKSTPYAAQVAADDAGAKAFEQGLRTLTVQVKGPGSGRETALRSLQSRGFKILSIKDTTPMPHNGARPPKRRRV